MIGVSRSETRALTTAVNAVPITTATARSTTLPRNRNVLKSLRASRPRLPFRLRSFVAERRLVPSQDDGHPGRMPGGLSRSNRACRGQNATVRAAAVASAQWGVIGLQQLRDCGVNASAADRWRRDGRLHTVHRGIYALGHPTIPIEGRLVAALLHAGPEAVLSHHSRGLVVAATGPGADRHRRERSWQAQFARRRSGAPSAGDRRHPQSPASGDHGAPDAARSRFDIVARPDPSGAGAGRLPPAAGRGGGGSRLRPGSAGRGPPPRRSRTPRTADRR